MIFAGKLMLGALIAGLFTLNATAGNLTPPGSPDSTMTTLSEVSAEINALEGRVQITSLPYTIDREGSYVVAKSLSLEAQDTNGINITVDNVTLDLNGFTLTGPGQSAGSTGVGIYVDAGVNVTVKDGTVQGFRGGGIFFDNSQSSRAADLNVYENGSVGIFVGTNGIVEGCNVRSNSSHGIRMGISGVVQGNSVRQNGGVGILVLSGCVVRDNAVYDNSSTGISASAGLITQNSSASNGGTGNISASGTIVDNYAP